MRYPRLLTLAIAVLSLGAVFRTAEAADTIRVITDRTESHLKPLFQHFEETTGTQVAAVYVGKGLLPRLQAQPTEADLVITKTAENMERARKEGLLQAFDSQALAGIDSRFVDPDRMYMITSYRARGIYASRERVKSGAIQAYMDLTKPEWKGRVAIRSGYHDYNISLFSQMAASQGIEHTRRFITGLKANLARTPQANDRGQVKAIHEGVADVSIGNSYYMGLMLDRDDQRPWGQSVHYYFPNQQGDGAYIMRAAAGLTTAERNVAGATRFLEYLAGDFAQYYLSSTLHVYSIKDTLPVSTVNKTHLGTEQASVADGRFKANFVSLREIDTHREAVVQILNEVNFDQ